MVSENEYDRLYANPPKSAMGRANRAALPVHGRRCSGAFSRAFDECFEMAARFWPC
jgi:hypothetical protein